MTDLRRVLDASAADHQITRAEAQQIAKAAHGSESKLASALEKEGFRSWEADGMAGKILQQAAVTGTGEPAALNFPAPAPVRSDHPTNFVKSRQARLDLVRSAPQQEPSDPSYMPLMSGGAVMAAAVVLDSVSADAARQNVEAIVSLARELGENPNLDQAALQRLAKGKATPRDVIDLQMLLMAMISHMPERPNQPGLTLNQLNAFVARLKEHGALQHTNSITFQGEQVSHHRFPTMALQGTQWSADIDGVHVQPWANDGDDRSAIVRT